MNRISRYIIRTSFAPFIFGTSIVIFLFLMQFLMKELDNLVGKGIDSFVILQLITYNIAWMFILAVPMGVLFASLATFGNMSANHEITILKASGGSLVRMMLPLLLVSAIITYLLFLYNSIIIPETNHQAVLLMYDIQRKKPTLAIEAGQFSGEIEGYTILAREVDTTDNTLYSTTIYDYKTPNVQRTINAQKCNIMFSKDMRKLEFVLKNGEIHQSVINDVKNYRYIKFDDYIISTNTSGFGFERTGKGAIGRGDREMFINDMQKIVDDSHKNAKEYKTKMQTIINNHLDYLLGTNISAEPQNNEKQINRTTNDKSANNENIQGKIKEIIVNSPRSVYDNRSQNEFDKTISEFIFSMNSLHSSILSNNEIANTYEVEIHKKYAIPFACIIFVLIGCPLGIITKGGNFGLSAAITLVFYIIYWACLIAGEKLADRLVISPFLSMWAGNIILGIAGILLTFKANNDSLSFSPIDIVNNLKQNFRLNKQRNL